MVYKSKISPGILILSIALFGGLSVVYIIAQLWSALAINLLVIAFIVYLFNTTYYTITGNILNVHSAFFYNTDIEISAIKSIEETNSILSAPALSMDRIEIFYNTYDSIVISPPNKLQFMEALKSINNTIEINLKEKKM